MKTQLALLLPLAMLAFARVTHAEDAPAPIQAATPAHPAAPLIAPPPQDEPAPMQSATPTRPAVPVDGGDNRRIRLDTPEVGRPVQRKYHLHEGFYLRMSVGFGDYSASLNDSNHSNQDFSEHGGSMALDLLIGGSPSPGVSIGGALLLEPLFGANYDRSGRGLGSHGGYSTLIGPFIDGFPDPVKGWHVGGMLGLAALSFQNVNETGGETATAGGVGGAAWFGYDFWVASEWSIGPQLRLMGMRTGNDQDGHDISAWSRSFTLGISGVYN